MTMEMEMEMDYIDPKVQERKPTHLFHANHPSGLLFATFILQRKTNQFRANANRQSRQQAAVSRQQATGSRQQSATTAGLTPTADLTLFPQ